MHQFSVPNESKNHSFYHLQFFFAEHATLLHEFFILEFLLFLRNRSSTNKWPVYIKLYACFSCWPNYLLEYYFFRLHIFLLEIFDHQASKVGLQQTDLVSLTHLYCNLIKSAEFYNISWKKYNLTSTFYLIYQISFSLTLSYTFKDSKLRRRKSCTFMQWF